ncbi:unnamed protein product [Arctia plantaginis]|uniref:Zinc finger CW-type PWWP domain protein 1 n=1 Tax=Arctia plantaginis TaxID=874455 RepID=A0A8S1AAR6_ARCPL|nr:unnamed protein product [Arctia plantaginis]
MKSGDLPNKKAFEPNEEAHQPKLNKDMPHNMDQKSLKKINFAKNVDSVEITSSYSNSFYKDILSQPAPGLSHFQKLLWLQKRRTTGLWVQCDECDRWRYMPNLIDRHELPNKWYCSMNSDIDFASCSVAEAPLRLRDEEDLIHSEYTAGSLVWARLTGWPWWPAMVDDCPDTEQFYWLDGFSDIPTHYNVVFFDEMEATRSWIAPQNLKPYTSNKNGFKYPLKNKKYNSRLKVAMAQADLAEKMVLAKRLENFCFLNRYKGSIGSPKKVSKYDLQKYQKRFKNKFNIEFPIESSDSDDDSYSDNASGDKNAPTIKFGKRLRLDKDKTSSLQTSNSKNDNYEKGQTDTVSKSLMSKNEVDTYKATYSIVAQVGSTEATSIDNDTSTTYLPDKGSENPDASIRIETPNSDDFDF